MKRENLLKKIRAGAKRCVIYVPEWADEGHEPVKLFFTPQTPADEIEVQNMLTGLDMPAGSEATYSTVALLVQKLEDDTGAKVFVPGDINDLMNQKSSLIARIARQISSGESFDDKVENAKKPSATPEASS